MADNRIISNSGSRMKRNQTLPFLTPEPGALTGLIVGVGDTVLSVQFSAAIGLVTGYKIYWSAVNVKPGVAGQTQATNANYFITGLTNGTLYYVWVEAYNGSGSGVFATASQTPNAA